MMNIKRLAVFIFGGLCLSLSGQAQTARWQIKPDYQGIESFAEGIYKVKTYNDMALISTSGETLLTADSITYLTNGYALGLTSSGDKYRITSIIDKNGKTTKVSQEVYLGEFGFFSEDKCAVLNKKGKYGYMGPDGKLIIPCNLVTAHPFREGRASVCKVKKGIRGMLGAIGPSVYIDAKGVEQKIAPEIGVVALASSYVDDKAYVQNQDDKMFLIDKQGKIIQSNPETVNLKCDDYFSLTYEPLAKANQPYVPSYNSAYSVFTEDGKSGYKAGNTIMLPAQFQIARGFTTDGYAIVKKNDKFGLIQQIGGSISFTVSEKDGKLDASGLLPAEWNNIQAKLIRIINNTDKTSFTLEGLDSNRKLSLDIPATTDKKVYEVEVDGLTIWQSKTSVPDSPQSSSNGKGGVSVKAPAVVKANSKGECAVTVRVTNNTGSAQTITVSLSVGGSKSIRLAAGRSGSVTIVTKVVRELKCTIIGRCPAGSGSCSTTLKPSFIL